MGVLLSKRSKKTAAAIIPAAHVCKEATQSIFHQAYTLVEQVLPGNDAAALRFDAIRVATGDRCTVQRVRRGHDNDSDASTLHHEAALLNKLNHANVVSCVEFVDDQDDEWLYLVLEPLDRGDLFDQIQQKTYFDEPDARCVVEQLLSAVAYCHAHGIVHHDIRPENLYLVTHDDNKTVLKLAGFGLATSGDENASHSMRGTPGYVAPEIVCGQRHGTAADVWSVGVVAFILLCGTPPIYGATDTEIVHKTKIGAFAFDAPAWETVSVDAKDFVRRALVRNQTDRWTAAQLLTHEWIAHAV